MNKTATKRPAGHRSCIIFYNQLFVLVSSPCRRKRHVVVPTYTVSHSWNLPVIYRLLLQRFIISQIVTLPISGLFMGWEKLILLNLCNNILYSRIHAGFVGFKFYPIFDNENQWLFECLEFLSKSFIRLRWNFDELLYTRPRRFWRGRVRERSFIAVPFFNCDYLLTLMHFPTNTIKNKKYETCYFKPIFSSVLTICYKSVVRVPVFELTGRHPCTLGG